jgi:hypothetical protein
MRVSRWGLLMALGLSAFRAPADESTALSVLADGWPAIAATAGGNSFDAYVADQLTYDDNLYRLPSSITDIAAVTGRNDAARQDHINSASVGVDGEWLLGTQAVNINLRADDNRYVRNDALNNISAKDSAVWDWRLWEQLSGQAGIDYYRAIASFANTTFYARDLVDKLQYFANARYQFGPHWAIFGGVLDADTSHSAPAAQLNDYHSKSGDVGIECVSASDNKLIWEYRYTDGLYPHDSVFNGAPFNPDYNEDTARLLFKYAFSDQTIIEAAAGYLKRYYPDARIGAFSGDIWRVSLQWQPKETMQFVLAGWRELTAYLDSESNYFVSKGGSVSPTWVVSDTVTLSLAISLADQDYIGSSASALAFVSRRDRVTAQQAHLIYAPTQALTFNITYRYEQRHSNLEQFQYDDKLATAGLTFKF